MSEVNKAILKEANAAISIGNIEGFLAFCTDDLRWKMGGDQTLVGKAAVRQWMAKAYVEPPRFVLNDLIAEGNFVVALGEITMKDEHGRSSQSSYCDVWRFHDGKMAELKAFFI